MRFVLSFVSFFFYIQITEIGKELYFYVNFNVLTAVWFTISFS